LRLLERPLAMGNQSCCCDERHYPAGASCGLAGGGGNGRSGVVQNLEWDDNVPWWSHEKASCNLPRASVTFRDYLRRRVRQPESGLPQRARPLGIPVASDGPCFGERGNDDEACHMADAAEIPQLEVSADVRAGVSPEKDSTLESTRDVAQFGVCTYVGEWQGEHWHGSGIIMWRDGRRYVGQLVHDTFHGRATMTWPDGREYVGQYEHMQKHGCGVFSWPDGRRYDGQWEDGKRHGKGVYTNSKGDQRGGLWVEDKPASWEKNINCSPVSFGGA